MRSFRRPAVALSALALAATLTGCADDDLDDTRPGTNQPPGTEPIIPDESPSLTP